MVLLPFVIPVEPEIVALPISGRLDNLYWTSSGNATYIAGAVGCQIARAAPGGFGTICLGTRGWELISGLEGGVFQSTGGGALS